MHTSDHIRLSESVYISENNNIIPWNYKGLPFRLKKNINKFVLSGG